MIRRIAITGPECTGKSRLAMDLAAYYKTVWVPEYARDYLAKLGRKYQFSDLLNIARKQYRMEEELARKAHTYLFCDTDFTVLKIWSEDKFKSCDPWIVEMFRTHIYDLYFLMDIDMTWIYDPQREDPDRREYLMNWYKKELDDLAVTYCVVNGFGKKRFINAISHLEAAF